MFTMPTRAAATLVLTSSATVPFALPFCPDTTLIHAAALVAFQAHPVIVVTSTERRPPAAAIASRERLNSKWQGAPAWLTSTFCDPTAIDPERGAGTVLGATEYGRTASPWPLWSPAIETHGASAATDHVQSRAVAMVTEALPPAAPNEVALLLTETGHLSAVGATMEVVEEVQLAERSAEATRAVERSMGLRIRFVQPRT